MALSTDEWLQQTVAALRAEDDPPAVVFVPIPPPTWQDAHHAEYSRRLLAVYAACDGWPRERVAPLWPFVEAASRAFEAEAGAPWGMALEELERRAGIA